MWSQPKPVCSVNFPASRPIPVLRAPSSCCSLVKVHLSQVLLSPWLLRYTRVHLQESKHNILIVMSSGFKFGKPMCNFHEKRVFFGAVPLNLTTTTSIHLENLGENHAYFQVRMWVYVYVCVCVCVCVCDMYNQSDLHHAQVSDPSPHPGLQVFPTSGCIAAKGTTELTLTLHTEQLGKVDTDITVQLRQGKTLHLKVIGSVQQPILHIDKVPCTHI